LKSSATSLKILGELVFITFSLVLRTAKAPESKRELLKRLVFWIFGRFFC